MPKKAAESAAAKPATPSAAAPAKQGGKGKGKGGKGKSAAHGEKKKRHAKRVESYASYIYKVLKQVHSVDFFLLYHVWSFAFVIVLHSKR